MATQPQTGLTYEDLRAIPEDNLRRELIDGELIVTAAPSTRHQDVVGEIAFQLRLHAKKHGGKAYPAPTDVYLTKKDIVEPDVVFVGPENLGKIELPFVRGTPDLVVEVSSPTTRRLEIVRKLELYLRFGVPEYWYVDLDAERVEIYRLEEGAYGRPLIRARGDSLDSPLLTGFELAVDELLGTPLPP